MNGWVIGGIVVFVAFIIFILIRMDWSQFSDNDEGFMGKLKALGDACCLGNIFKRH